MSDPLSIIASVLTLLQVSVQVTVLLRQVRNEVNGIDATLNGLLADVASFQQVLESMKETFSREEIRSNLQTTGHVGSHWRNLARSLEDGTETMGQLAGLLENINKTTRFLGAPRKALRFKTAVGQIAGHREQIQSYRAALQLSLSTVILWNQVTFQESTERIPEKIVPTLDKLYEEFCTFGAELNAKIDRLQIGQDKHELKTMSNLRECVRSAADVVSTTSSTLTVDPRDNMTGKYGSEFGGVFTKEANEPLLRWMSCTVVPENEKEVPPRKSYDTSTGGSLIEHEYDSDSDIEIEMIKALFNDAKRLKKEGDLRTAERKLRNCLTRISADESSIPVVSITSLPASGVSRLEVLELLTEIYCLLGSWAKAKATMVKKLSITEKQTGREEESYLWDTMKLAELSQKNKEYVEAQLQARRSLRGFKKLGEGGLNGYENCLKFLIQLCREEGRLDEEDAYAALLSSHQAKVRQTKSPMIPQTTSPKITQITSPRSTTTTSILSSPTPLKKPAYLAGSPTSPIRSKAVSRPHVPKKPESLRQKEGTKSQPQLLKSQPINRRFTSPAEQYPSFQSFYRSPVYSTAQEDLVGSSESRDSLHRTLSAPLNVENTSSFRQMSPQLPSRPARPNKTASRYSWASSNTVTSGPEADAESGVSNFLSELFDAPSIDSPMINFLTGFGKK